MRYKIGDVARILGISTDLLRYYEKKGVVRPVKDARNDYRYYEPWDINFLLDCLWFKNFGFGIEEISHMVTDSSYDDLHSSLDRKEEQLERELRRQELRLRRLREHKQELERGMAFLGQCDVADSPEMVRYLNRHNFIYDDSPALARLSRQWLDYMPFIHRCFEIKQSDLPGGDGAGNFSWGMALELCYARELGVALDPPVEHLPSRRCLHSVFKSTGKDAFSPGHLQYLVDYAARSGLTICGSARGNLLCSVAEEGGLSGYFEVWVPIADTSRTETSGVDQSQQEKEEGKA